MLANEKYSFQKYIIIIVVAPLLAYSMVSRFLPSPISNIWGECDSVFVGAEIIVKDSTEDVVITWKDVYTTDGLSTLSVMLPQRHDSAVFLFHNFIALFPEESTSVNIGKFPTGTPIVLQHVVVDTAEKWNGLREKKQYTGQNRETIDEYVSDRKTTNYGYRWAAVGRADSSRVQVGFSDGRSVIFENLLVEINGCYVGGIEKYKLPSVKIIPESPSFSQLTKVLVSLEQEASIIYIENYINFQLIKDTIAPLTEGKELSIYYTTDGSDPIFSSTRQKYTDSFTITSSTVIKACATIEIDTNWFPSEVSTKVYTKGETNINKNSSMTQILSNPADCSIYSLNGRHLHSLHTTDAQITAYTSSLPTGIYFLRFKGITGAKWIVVGR